VAHEFSSDFCNTQDGRRRSAKVRTVAVRLFVKFVRQKPIFSACTKILCGFWGGFGWKAAWILRK
jgi:hypothetical protein